MWILIVRSLLLLILICLGLKVAQDIIERKNTPGVGFWFVLLLTIFWFLGQL